LITNVKCISQSASPFCGCRGKSSEVPVVFRACSTLSTPLPPYPDRATTAANARVREVTKHFLIPESRQAGRGCGSLLRRRAEVQAARNSLHASWCGPCNVHSLHFSELSGEIVQINFLFCFLPVIRQLTDAQIVNVANCEEPDHAITQNAFTRLLSSPAKSHAKRCSHVFLSSPLPPRTHTI